jgi:hypothetical protein
VPPIVFNDEFNADLCEASLQNTPWVLTLLHTRDCRLECGHPKREGVSYLVGTPVIELIAGIEHTYHTIILIVFAKFLGMLLPHQLLKANLHRESRMVRQ